MSFDTYEDFENYLKHLEKFGMVFGLHHISTLLASLGNPHHRFKSIHIAGSNGKGSTAAMIQQTLTEAGMKCGLYTSPHLQRFSERFVIDGREISRSDLLKHANRLIQGIARDGIQEGFTYFDFTTALAFDYFAESHVDIAVVETGLGGRLDSTNILTPEISIITPISLEHTQVLGDTLEKIAAEKAGIIKKHTPVIIGKQPPSALHVLIERAANEEAPAYVFGRDFFVTIRGNTFIYRQDDFTSPPITISLLGPHQKENAATAFCALRVLKGLGFPLREESIGESFRHVRWPGRGEIFLNVSDPSIRIMLDGAHNPGGAEMLARSLNTLQYNRLHIMIGILADKDIEEIANRLLSLADRVIAVTPHSERAPDIRSFSERLRPYLAAHTTLDTAGSIAEALPLAVAGLKKADLLVITGSLYTVGEARNLIEKDKHWENPAS